MLSVAAQFDLPFYLDYLAKWPEYCLVAEGPGGQVMGYILGKVVGRGENWHGHVTAVTVAPEYRCARLKSRCCAVRPHTLPLWSLCLSLPSCIAIACAGSAPPLPLSEALLLQWSWHQQASWVITGSRLPLGFICKQRTSMQRGNQDAPEGSAAAARNAHASRCLCHAMMLSAAPKCSAA